MSSRPARLAIRMMRDASKLASLFDEFAQPESPGASTTVIQEGEVLFARGFGLANLEERIPCGLETNFRLASVTKQFTAMAILTLVERGKLSFDERLTELFPEFPAYGEQIKVEQLLTHTSGLIDYEDLMPRGTRMPLHDRDVLGLLLRQDKTYFPPGTRYRYSNSGYALLALLVESRSGETFAHYLHGNIFQPLGMAHTLAYEAGLSSVPNRAFGYSRAGRGFKRTDQSLTSAVLGDGGVYSSVTDLCRWDQALYTEKLVSGAMLRRAFAPVVRTDLPDTGYGMGWYVGSFRKAKEVWHHGETTGFRTHISRFPKWRLTVIVLANRSEARLAALPHRIVDLCFERG
jgi:CubicO group peptidase (beta-lactamase class C family)